MEYEIRHDAISVDASERSPLTLSYMDDAEDEGKERKQDNARTCETLLLSDSAENEVGMLLGNVFKFRLSSVEESFSGHSAGAYRDLGLIDVVAEAPGVVDNAEGNLDSHLLMRLEHVTEDIIDRE